MLRIILISKGSCQNLISDIYILESLLEVFCLAAWFWENFISSSKINENKLNMLLLFSYQTMIQKPSYVLKSDLCIVTPHICRFSSPVDWWCFCWTSHSVLQLKITHNWLHSVRMAKGGEPIKARKLIRFMMEQFGLLTRIFLIQLMLQWSKGKNHRHFHLVCHIYRQKYGNMVRLWGKNASANINWKKRTKKIKN